MNKEIIRKKQHKPMSMKEYSNTINQGNGPVIVIRNEKEPKILPHLQPGVKIIDPKKEVTPSRKAQVAEPYGTKQNVPSENLIAAIRKTLGEDNYALHVSDESYTGYTLFELNEFIKNFDSTNLNVWVKETFDCDDFSQVLQGNVNGFFKGITFGTIWYGPRDDKEMWGHSVNIFYDYSTGKVYLIEPQSDSFYEFDKNKWKARMVII